MPLLVDYQFLASLGLLTELASLSNVGSGRLCRWLDYVELP